MNKEVLQTLVGKTIKVDRGGPESRVGKLLGVSEDHFTILTEADGVVYYLTHHIKSLTENTKKGLPFELEIPEVFVFVTAPTLFEVMESLKYNWVKINRGGKESVEGVLDDINLEYITIVHNEEIIRIATFHIHNISYGLKIEKPQKEESEKQEDKKDDKKEEKTEEKSSEK